MDFMSVREDMVRARLLGHGLEVGEQYKVPEMVFFPTFGFQELKELLFTISIAVNHALKCQMPSICGFY